jgi:recombination protein RecA
MAKVKEEEKKLNLEETIKALTKTYGQGSIVNFTDNQTREYDVIPTGSIKIDFQALGVGGFCRSKMYMVKGWEGSNKTTLCGHLTANCQKQGGKVVYLDGEHALDVTYMENLHVDMSNFILIQPDNFESGMEMALKLMETGEIALLIVDSDSSLLPKGMMESEVGTQTIGKKAKANSETYPKIKLATSKFNVCTVVTCQYRINPGQMFGDNRVIPGGHALAYWADVIVDLTKRLRKEGDETSGTETTFKTTKNKTFIPYREVIFTTLFGVGIDKLDEILQLGKEFDLWKLRAKVVTYNDVKYSEEDFQAMLVDNPEFYEEVKNKIIDLIKNPVTEELPLTEDISK